MIGSVLQTKAQARVELQSTGASEEWIQQVTANLRTEAGR